MPVMSPNAPNRMPSFALFFCSLVAEIFEMTIIDIRMASKPNKVGKTSPSSKRAVEELCHRSIIPILDSTEDAPKTTELLAD